MAKKRLREAAPAAAVTPAGNNLSNTQNTGTVQTDDENQTQFTADDVANMTPGDVLNYVYVNPPQNIDMQTKQALLKRADEIRKDADAGKDVKQRAEEILKSIKMVLPTLK